MSLRFRWPRRSSVLVSTAAVCLLLAPAAHGGQLLGDGVVIHSGTAYLMSPDGGIEALDLASGASRWLSGAAAKPLHLAAGLLIAQGETSGPGVMRLAALDAASGASRHHVAIPLPAGVWAGVDDRPRSAFRCHAGGNAGSLSVSWNEIRPVDDRFGVPAPALDQASGPVIAPAADGGRRSGAAVVDLVAGGFRPIEPGSFAAETLTAPVAQTGVFLEGVEGRQWRSADGAHVLAAVRTGPPATWQKYRWSIYTATGDLVGSVSHHSATAPFVVAGTTLVFREQPHTVVTAAGPVDAPLRLRALDLASGAEAWSRELRDTAFRGPFEP